jgi:hypothetical protein
VGIPALVGLPDDELEWHEVVHNVRFTTSRDTATGNRWRSNWRYTFAVVRRDILPLLLTAVALSIALLTLVGLIAQQVPWSSQHRFGESQSGSHSTSDPAIEPVAAIKSPGRGSVTASATPSATPTPAAASGAAPLATATNGSEATSTGSQPTNPPLIALPGAAVQVSLDPSGAASLGVSLPLQNLPLVGQLLPLPSASVGVSVSAPPLLDGLLAPKK